MRSVSPALLALVVLLVGLVAGARPARAADSTVTASPDVFVTVELVSGSVRVLGTTRREVKVSGSEGVSVTASDGGARVAVSLRPGAGGDGIDVSVPSTAHVEVHAVSGNVSVRDVTGPVQATAVNGNVEVSGGARDVEARSVSGNVNVSLAGARGDVRASTVSGNLTLQMPGGGTAWVKTVSGPVHVTAAPLTRLEVQGLSGTLTIDTRLDGAGPFSAHTHSGAINVTLPKNATTTIDARSYRGNVEVPDGGAPPPGLSHSVLSLSTFSGTISVTRK